MNPAVSIVTPCYNAEPFLRQTIASVLEQTVQPLELIVVDDGSTDTSAAIAESYGGLVRVLRQANQGESVARNVGLAAARGDLIVFLDADDVLERSQIERQLRAIHGVKNGVACTGYSVFHDDIAQAFAPTMPSATAFFPDVITANLAPPSCWMVPKAIVLQAGCFYSAQQYFEDWDLWWRVGMTDATLVPVHEVGFFYRQHLKSQLSTVPRPDRAYGHAWLMERMARAMLERDDLLQPHGALLFWSAWGAVQNCRALGVPWERLRLLTNVIEEIVRRKPESLHDSSMASAVEWVGVRKATALARLRGNTTAAPSYRPNWAADKPQTT